MSESCSNGRAKVRTATLERPQAHAEPLERPEAAIAEPLERPEAAIASASSIPPPLGHGSDVRSLVAACNNSRSRKPLERLEKPCSEPRGYGKLVSTLKRRASVV